MRLAVGDDYVFAPHKPDTAALLSVLPLHSVTLLRVLHSAQS